MNVVLELYKESWKVNLIKVEKILEYSKSHIRSIGLIGFKEIVESYGCNAEKLVQDANLDPRLLTHSNLVYPYQAHVDLWELAALRLGEADLGLKFALSAAPNLPSLGPVVLLAQFEKNVDDWFRSVIHHLKYHNSAIQALIIPVEDSDDVIFRLSTDPYIERGRQVSEADAALILLMVRKVIDLDSFKPKIVRFPHPRPQNTALHSEIFKSELEFDAPFLEAVLSKDFLSIPLRSPLRFVRPIANWFVRRIVNSSPTAKTSMVHKVRMGISMHLGTKRLNINDISSTLGKHPKQLQRELIAEGTNYSSILESVREEIACSLLESSNVSVLTIAGYLDYSNSTAFLHAFKRWKNITPTQYRKKFKIP